MILAKSLSLESVSSLTMQWYSRYKNDFRQNLLLAFPIIVGQVGQLSVNVADNIMVGSLGAAPLASISLSIAIFVLFMILGFGISFGLPPLVSEAHASGHSKRISQFFKHSLFINVAYSLFSLVCLLGIVPFMDYMGQDVEVIKLAKPYLIISAWSMIPLMLFQTFRTYADGMSETYPAMIAILIGNVVNIALNYTLIFGKFGAPALGVNGAALGTLISRILMVVVIIFIVYRWKNLWFYIVQANLKRYSKAIFKRVLGLSIPTSMQMFFEVSAFSCATIMMGLISKEAQAAHQIAINLAAITFLICTGLAMAATIRVGNQLGLQDGPAVRKVGFSAVIQIIVFMAICALIFIVFRHWLPTLYIDDPKVINIAVGLIILAGVFQIPDGIQVTTLGALRGLQDVKVPTLITFFAYFVVGIPSCIVLAFGFDMGPPGIWIGLVISLIVSAVLLGFRFNKLSKQI